MKYIVKEIIIKIKSHKFFGLNVMLRIRMCQFEAFFYRKHNGILIFQF